MGGRQDRLASALPFVAWSRIWSPLVPESWREESWQALGLPGSWPRLEPDYWATFQTGLPAPPVPLLLHAALNRDGSGAREDWLRVMAHLGLTWDRQPLAPDHLAVACEILACALEREEDVLARELCLRYLLPWCAEARARLQGEASPLARLPERFEGDLQALSLPRPSH